MKPKQRHPILVKPALPYLSLFYVWQVAGVMGRNPGTSSPEAPSVGVCRSIMILIMMMMMNMAIAVNRFLQGMVCEMLPR